MIRRTARQRVLDYLTRHPDSTAPEVGRALDLAAATVRHHLGILLADGRIVISGAQRVGGRGRPLKLYRLSEGILGNNLAMVAETLLLEAQRGPSAAHRKVLGALAAGLVLALDDSQMAAPAPRRIALLVERLNRLHYDAKWEAGAQGPRILFGHCPYSAIIERHPELCQMDARALGHLMHSTAEQIAKLDVPHRTVTHCVFLLR